MSAKAQEIETRKNQKGDSKESLFCWYYVLMGYKYISKDGSVSRYKRPSRAGEETVRNSVKGKSSEVFCLYGELSVSLAKIVVAAIITPLWSSTTGKGRSKNLLYLVEDQQDVVGEQF